MEEKEFNSGALLDTRPEELKLKDFKFEELVASADPVNWVAKQTFRSFPIFNQDGSGSCVAQTGAKLLGIMYWLKNKQYVHFSATHLYQRRSNKPGGGMIGVNCFDIMREGVTLEELVPSQNMNDAQMDSIDIPEYKDEVGKIFKISNYVVVPVKNIDTIASIIQKTGKGVMVWFYFTYAEWTTEPKVLDPNLDLYGANTARHSVTAVDFTIHNGKKAIVIEDSWGPYAGKGGQRIIDEDFFKARNFFAGYALDFKFDQGEEIGKPKYTFSKTIYFTTNVKYGDKEVIALQDCLKWLGHFPKNIESTGYFGAVTKRAVQAFQSEKGLKADGIVGPATRAKLNEIFGN